MCPKCGATIIRVVENGVHEERCTKCNFYETVGFGTY